MCSNHLERLGAWVCALNEGQSTCGILTNAPYHVQAYSAFCEQQFEGSRSERSSYGLKPSDNGYEKALVDNNLHQIYASNPPASLALWREA